MSTPYQILGVKPGASVAVVKRAHRRLALKHHPDRPGGSDARMAEIIVDVVAGTDYLKVLWANHDHAAMVARDQVVGV